MCLRRHTYTHQTITKIWAHGLNHGSPIGQIHAGADITVWFLLIANLHPHLCFDQGPGELRSIFRVHGSYKKNSSRAHKSSPCMGFEAQPCYGPAILRGTEDLLKASCKAVKSALGAPALPKIDCSSKPASYPLIDTKYHHTWTMRPLIDVH